MIDVANDVVSNRWRSTRLSRRRRAVVRCLPVALAGLFGHEASFAQSQDKVCFYEHAKYGGRSYCVAPGRLQKTLPDWIDRKISSVRVPAGLRYVAYTGTDGDGQSFSIDRDTDIKTLGSMNDAIRSVQVASKRIPCVQNCTINNEASYDLFSIFDKQWGKASRLHATLTFQMLAGQSFSTELADIKVDIQDNLASVRTRTGQGLTSVRMPREGHFGTVLFSTDAFNQLEAQVVITDAQHRYLVSTPIVRQPMPRQTNSILSIYADGSDPARSRSILLDGLSLAYAANTDTVAPLRASSCWDRPLLAGMMLAVGQCPKPGVTTFYGRANDAATPQLTVVAGNAVPKQPAYPMQASYPGVTALLDDVIGEGQSPLSVHAAARVCDTPLDATAQSFSKPRTGTTLTCANAVADLVNLYQAAYMPYWNAQSFDDVVKAAREGRPAPYTPTNADAARKFAATVTAGVLSPARVNRTFREADALYNQANLATLSYEDMVARADGKKAVQYYPTVPMVNRDAIGLYTLDLRTWTASPPRPQTFINNQWRNAADGIETQVIYHDNGSWLYNVEQTLSEWEGTFRGKAVAETDAVRKRLLDVGQSIAWIMREEVRVPLTSHMVTVTASYRGTIVAILRGHIYDDGSATVDHVLSGPDNTTLPYAGGALRGGGAHALSAFLDHAKTHGVVTAHAHMVTRPIPSPWLLRGGMSLSD